MASIPIGVYESAAFNGLGIINTVEDPLLNLSGSHHIKLGGHSISGFIGRGANLAEVQVNGKEALPLAESTEVVALAADFTAEDFNPLHYDVPLKELISVQVDNSNNNEATAVIFLIDGRVWIGSPPPGKKFKIIQVESTTAAAAGVWTNVGGTYPNDLPAEGMATVYGMRCKSASGYAVRAIQTERFGVPTQHAAKGPFIWFEQPAQIDLANRPSFEVFSSTTTAVHNLELAVKLPED